MRRLDPCYAFLLLVFALLLPADYAGSEEAAPADAERPKPARAPKFMRKALTGWRVVLIGAGSLDILFQDGDRQEGYGGLAFAKMLPIHGRSDYRPALVVQDIGVMRPAYLIPLLYTSCFRPFCPQIVIEGQWAFIGSAHRGEIRVLSSATDGPLVFSFEFIFRAHPIIIEYDLFRLSGVITLDASQDGVEAEAEAILRNISGRPVRVLKSPDQDRGQYKAGTLLRLLMLQSSYTCEPIVGGAYPEFVRDSQKGLGGNRNYRFHTDDLRTKEKVLMPPYLSRSIFLGSKEGEIEYRLSNDTSAYETYDGELSPYAKLIQGVHGMPDARSLRSHNDLMPLCSWSVELVSTSGSLGSALKAALQHSIVTGHGPDADNVSAFYAPAPEYFRKTGGTIPADFEQHFTFVIRNPPEGTVLRYPVPPKVLTADRTAITVETGVDVPEDRASLPVTLQLFLSDKPLDDATMPAPALEKTFPVVGSQERVELDIAELTRRYEGEIYARILAHCLRTYAVDLPGGRFSRTQFTIE